MVAYYATLKLGGVNVLIQPDSAPEIVARQITDVGARWVIALSQDHDVLATLAELPQTRSLLVDLRHELPAAVYHQQAERRGWPLDSHGAVPPGALWLSELLEKATSSGEPAVAIEPRKPAVIAYTSGSSGAARPACLSHRNLVANIMQTRHWAPVWRYGRERCLSVLPLRHSYPMTTGMNLPIAIGATIVLLPYLDLPTLLELSRQHRPSMFPAVPSLYIDINQVPNVRRYGLARINACLSGVAPMPVEAQESFEKLTRARILEGFTLTEAAPVTHANPFLGQRREGSIGLPLPNTDARIVEFKSRVPLPIGAVGELQVRGPQVFAGYWGEEEAPFEAGWFATGDMALMDDAGYFRILNRVKDLIEVQGETIYPRDVEEVLYEHPDVKEAVVMGASDDAGETQIKAYVVRIEGKTLDAADLKEWCVRRLPRNAVPQWFEFREALPQSAIGTFLREELI